MPKMKRNRAHEVSLPVTVNTANELLGFAFDLEYIGKRLQRNGYHGKGKKLVKAAFICNDAARKIMDKNGGLKL